MRRLYWLGVATGALVLASAAVGAVPRTVSVTGKVQAVSSVSITVNGTTCGIAPTNPRMMMPAIIRDISAGDHVLMVCLRAAGGRLLVAKIVERPAGAVVVRGAVTNATDNSITVRGLTCTFVASGGPPPNPKIMAPTWIRGGQALMACLRANGQLVLTAAAELKPHPGQVILISGPVSAKSTTSITVSGITCFFARTTKPLPGMPIWIKEVDAGVGDSVLMACTAQGGHLVATGVTNR
jgi:hypothetical protein